MSVEADIQGLYATLPHAGAMRLISRVLAWDQRSICCRICNHLNPEHPMRHQGALPAVCSLEYAAQAAALHAVLAAGAERRGTGRAELKRAFVVTLRQMSLNCDDLASRVEPLLLRVDRVFEQQDSAVFDFTLQVESSIPGSSATCAGAALLAEGQFGVMYGQ